MVSDSEWQSVVVRGSSGSECQYVIVSGIEWY